MSSRVLPSEVSRVTDAIVASVPTEDIRAIVLASSWATGEVTREVHGRILSDMDFHVVLYRGASKYGEQISRAAERAVVGVEVDCNVVDAKILRRMQRTIEAANTRSAGYTVWGDPTVLEYFPVLADVPASESERLLLNRARELVSCFATSKDEVERGYACVKALVDIGTVRLFRQGHLPPTYRARMDALAVTGTEDCILAAYLMKLGELPLPQSADSLYHEARALVLREFNQYHGPEIWRKLAKTDAFGPTWKSWARILRNPRISPSWRIPTPRLLHRNARVLYSLVFLRVLERADHAKSYASATWRAKPLYESFPLWRRPRNIDGDIGEVLRPAMALAAADQSGWGVYP